MTIFEVPHRSLGSEMTRSYTERTSIFAARELLGWFGGLFNAFLAYTIFFKDTPDYESIKQLNGTTLKFEAVKSVLIS